MKGRRNLFAGVMTLGLLGALGVGQHWLETTAAAQAGGAKQAPRFEVDPMWPKPLPNNWLLGNAIGVAVDSRNHVWIVHRSSATLGNNEKGMELTPPTSTHCCKGAPPILEFDQEGTVVNSWGGPVAGAPYEWPDSNHGIDVETDGTVWIGGNGPNDGHVLKFTREGKFIQQIGKKGVKANSQAKDHFFQVAKIFIDEKGNEIYVSDGYGNKRVAVIDRKTGEMKRFWGAYGNPPSDENLGRYNPTAPLVAAVPQPGALRRAVERQHRLRLRPRERPHPDLHEGRQVPQGSPDREGVAGRRFGVGPRVLDRPAAALPVRGGRPQPEDPRAGPPVARGALLLRQRRPPSRVSGTACTPSPSTRRATCTRPRPMRASAFRSSSTRASAR